MSTSRPTRNSCYNLGVSRAHNLSVCCFSARRTVSDPAAPPLLSQLVRQRSINITSPPAARKTTYNTPSIVSPPTSPPLLFADVNAQLAPPPRHEEMTNQLRNAKPSYVLRHNQQMREFEEVCVCASASVLSHLVRRRQHVLLVC
jgi:hypothetical protein